MSKWFLFILCFAALVSCEKETSVEGDGSVKIATGTLLDSSGNCQQHILLGDYLKDSTLKESNKLVAKVTFIEPGNYTIYSDTVNGMWFRTKAFAFVPGSQTVGVQGFGKMLANVDAVFTLHFLNSKCSFKVKKFTPVLVNGTSNDYFPTTNFSTWVYDNSLINDTTITSVLGLDKNILGNTYRKFLLSVPKFFYTDTLYFRKDGFGNYYTYDTIASGPKTEYAFLKDFLVKTDTFSSPLVNGNWQGVPTPVKYFYTVLFKNVKRTIQGNVIDNIIIMQQETQYLINNVFETKNTIELSYAKNKGLVNYEQKNAVINTLAPIRKWTIN